MSEKAWFHAKGGVPNGPLDEDAIAALLRSNDISGETLVWSQGMANWMALRDTNLVNFLMLPPPLPIQEGGVNFSSSSSPLTKNVLNSQNSRPNSSTSTEANQTSMNFVKSFNICYEKYAEFSGRSIRSEYWYFTLYVFIFNIILGLLEFVIGPGFVILSVLLIMAFIFIPSISVTVRRLHDTDRSGWWALLLIVPLIGFLVLLIFLCQRGTPGPNRFGPDPLAPA
jgi:uncharacterized membrane protein YhaH (DUF805 family)